MLSAAAYSFRMQSRLAISLSWIAGFANVIVLGVCGVSISHVTGNLTHLGQHVGGPNLVAGLFVGYLVACFLIGAMTAGFMLEIAKQRGMRSKYVLPVATEAALLALFGLILEAHNHHFGNDRMIIWWMTGLASIAMGIQNATITKISGAVVRTTHLTGVATDLGLEGSQLLLYWWDKLHWLNKVQGRRSRRPMRLLRVSTRHPTVLRIALLASIFGSFLFGVIAGVLMYHWLPDYAMALPVSFLIWIIYVDWRKPIADVRELDPLHDEEAGHTRELASVLPEGVGVYRLTHHKRRGAHHAPDFQLWADRLPRHWRVIILAISPMTAFDSDAALNLTATARRLAADGRKLILSGVTARQYKILFGNGLGDVLGAEDVSPDLEFAVARAIEAVRSENKA